MFHSMTLVVSISLEVPAQCQSHPSSFFPQEKPVLAAPGFSGINSYTWGQLPPFAQLQGLCRLLDLSWQHLPLFFPE